MNSRLIRRNPTRMDCLLAFLSPASVDLLTSFVNDAIATTRTKEQLERQRHFSAIDAKEVWSWIAQRLDISLNLKVSIDVAYKSVRLLLWLSLPFTPFLRRRSTRQAGCLSIASILSMATW